MDIHVPLEQTPDPYDLLPAYKPQHQYYCAKYPSLLASELFQVEDRVVSLPSLSSRDYSSFSALKTSVTNSRLLLSSSPCVQSSSIWLTL
jgi:hypothetical protein